MVVRCPPGRCSRPATSVAPLPRSVAAERHDRWPDEERMGVREREEAYIRRQRRLLPKGDGTAASNIAAAYRILGRHRLAFGWWRKGAARGDGDALLEVGYCYQHGLGVRR